MEMINNNKIIDQSKFNSVSVVFASSPGTRYDANPLIPTFAARNHQKSKKRKTEKDLNFHVNECEC